MELEALMFRTEKQSKSFQCFKKFLSQWQLEGSHILSLWFRYLA